MVGNYVADLVIDDSLLIELKAEAELNRACRVQVMNYLRATGMSVGLLLNFGTPKLGIQRIVYQYNESEVI